METFEIQSDKFGKWVICPFTTEELKNRRLVISKFTFRNKVSHVDYTHSVPAANYVLKSVNNAFSEPQLVAEALERIMVPISCKPIQRSAIYDIGIRLIGAVSPDDCKIIIGVPEFSLIDLEVPVDEQREMLEALSEMFSPKGVTVRLIV